MGYAANGKVFIVMAIILREWQVRSDIKVQNGFINLKLKFVSSAIARSLEIHQPQIILMFIVTFKEENNYQQKIFKNYTCITPQEKHGFVFTLVLIIQCALLWLY